VPQNTELRRVSANPDRGVCAQDFETTIQPYVSAQHLRGLLNFSALWNQVTYIYDTAIGDNPNLGSCRSTFDDYILLPIISNVTFWEYIQ
jgi:hypothetical protein